MGIFYEAGKISLVQEFACNLVELSTKLHTAGGVVLAGILYEGKAAYPFEAGCVIIKTNFQEKWKIRPANCLIDLHKYRLRKGCCTLP